MQSQTTHTAGTILIVDDDAINRKVLSRIFSDSYPVEEAENGRIGAEKLLVDPGRYAAVLLDVIMPEMSGIEMLRVLYQHQLFGKLPVFLITSEQSADVIHEAYRLGVMDVLHKPVVSFVTYRRVSSMIELFRARRELKEIAEQQGMALTAQTREINQLSRGMLEALATAIEFRNEEHGGHVQRIAQITRTLLESTDYGKGMSSQQIENIALASAMHDVGKIMIPDTILTKPGGLTAEECRIMESHTVNGVIILENFSPLRGSDIFDYACDIARHHHERWDGSGYPDGLAGDAISPWAQVVALADMYDALNCRRIYRPPFPRERVLETIQKGRGTLFSPRLVEQFLPVEEQFYRFYEDIALENGPAAEPQHPARDGSKTD